MVCASLTLFGCFAGTCFLCAISVFAGCLQENTSFKLVKTCVVQPSYKSFKSFDLFSICWVVKPHTCRLRPSSCCWTLAFQTGSSSAAKTAPGISLMLGVTVPWVQGACIYLSYSARHEYNMWKYIYIHIYMYIVHNMIGIYIYIQVHTFH